MVDKDQRWARRPKPFGALDGLGIFAFVIVCLVLSYFRSRHRVFWSDEIMGWIVLKQPAFPDVLRLWRTGIDSSGIWYYVLGRLWTGLLGSSEVSLRMYSAVGVAAGGALTWLAARRFYEPLPVAAAVCFVFAANAPLRWQLANARTYGWLIFASGLVLYLIARGQDEQYGRPKIPFLFATFLGYSALAGSHILGVAYVGAFLAIQVILDLWCRRPRPILYLSALCSLTVVFFSRGNLAATAAMGKPNFWTLKPALRDLANLSQIFGKSVSQAVCIFLLLAVLSFRFQKSRRLSYVLFGVFAILDWAIFLYSRVTTSIYVDRYLLPFCLVAVFLLCELLTSIAEAELPHPSARRALPWLGFVAAAAYLFQPSLQHEWFPYRDQTKDLIARLPPGLLTIDTDVANFVQLEFYGHPQVELVFPLDKQMVIDGTPKMDSSGFNEMNTWTAQGIHAQDIEPTGEVLKYARDFAVITNSMDQRWLQGRVLSDPQFSATLYATSPNEPYPEVQIWLVHRIQPLSSY